MRQHTHCCTRSSTTQKNSWISGVQETCCRCCAYQPTHLQWNEIQGHPRLFLHISGCYKLQKNQLCLDSGRQME